MSRRMVCKSLLSTPASGRWEALRLEDAARAQQGRAAWHRANLPAAVEQDCPALDAGRPQHAALRPGILPQPLVDRVLGLRLDDPQHLAVALEWAAEQDETRVDEAVHETCVLVPANLLAHVARPVPGPPSPEPDDVVRHAPRLAEAGPRRVTTEHHVDQVPRTTPFPSVDSLSHLLHLGVAELPKARASVQPAQRMRSPPVVITKDSHH